MFHRFNLAWVGVVTNLVLCRASGTFTNEFVVQIIDDHLDEVRSALQRYNMVYEKHIVTNCHLFMKTDVEQQSSDSVPTWLLQSMEDAAADWVKSIEQQELIFISSQLPDATVLSDTRDDPATTKSALTDDAIFTRAAVTPRDHTLSSSENPSKDQPFFYGLRVKDVWDIGVYGNRSVIAVLDIGIQLDHPNLRQHIDTSLDYDFIDSDTNASYPPVNNNYPEWRNKYAHGTKCAGLIVASEENGCTGGVAPSATIVPLRVVGVNDKYPIQEYTTSVALAEALLYLPDNISVYSCSFGRKDGDMGFQAISLIEEALRKGVETGRGNKGSVYVVPSGNGAAKENCNADFFANSVDTITVGALNTSGHIPSYTESCPCTLAVTFGNGNTNHHTNMVTTDIGSVCTDEFGGTSAATAVASGVIGLVLDANPRLSKRDIEHLIVTTASRSYVDEDVKWRRNGAGHYYNERLGFGVMDAKAMVDSALRWRSVPEKHICQTSFQEIVVRRGMNSYTMQTDGCANSKDAVTTLEHVQIEVSGARAGTLSCMDITLESPTGTRSVLMMSSNPKGCGNNEIVWKFMTVHFWGETADGSWTVHIGTPNSCEACPAAPSVDYSLIFHGTGAERMVEGTTHQYTAQPNGKGDDEESLLLTSLIIGGCLVFVFLGGCACAVVATRRRCFKTPTPSTDHTVWSKLKIQRQNSSTYYTANENASTLNIVSSSCNTRL